MKFFSAQNKSENVAKQGTHGPLGNQVIRKGYMAIHYVGKLRGSRDYWFVLTSQNLSWYKDEEERDTKFMLTLNGLKIRDIEQGFMSRRHTFALFNQNNQNVFKVFLQNFDF